MHLSEATFLYQEVQLGFDPHLADEYPEVFQHLHRQEESAMEMLAWKHSCTSSLGTTMNSLSASGLKTSPTCSPRLSVGRNTRNGDEPWQIPRPGEGGCVSVTERKRAEAALHKTEARFREWGDDSLCGVYWVTPESELLHANEALAPMLGYNSARERLAVEGAEAFNSDLSARKKLSPSSWGPSAQIRLPNGSARTAGPGWRTTWQEMRWNRSEGTNALE